MELLLMFLIDDLSTVN